MKAIDQLTKFFDEKKLKYTKGQVPEGKEYLTIGVNGRSLAGFHVTVFFDEEDQNSAGLRVFDICKLPEEKRAQMLDTVNRLHNSYRWATFSITHEGILIAGTDVSFTKETAAQLIFESLNRIVNVVDSAYPTIMKDLFS